MEWYVSTVCTMYNAQCTLHYDIIVKYLIAELIRSVHVQVCTITGCFFSIRYLESKK